MYGLTIGWGANIVHDTIGMMVWCNYVLDSLGNNNFCIARPETLPRHLGWTNTHLGHPERPIPFWEINSTLHLSIQISMYPPPTTVPCWQCRCHIPVWDPTKLWPFRSNSREWSMLISHALQASSHREYAILVQNTRVIWCFKERGTMRNKTGNVNIYSSKIF